MLQTRLHNVIDKVYKVMESSIQVYRIKFTLQWNKIHNLWNKCILLWNKVYNFTEQGNNITEQGLQCYGIELTMLWKMVNNVEELVCRRKTDLTFANRICHIKHFISKYIQIANVLKYLSNTYSKFMFRFFVF
jgi:hypothetical protein